MLNNIVFRCGGDYIFKDGDCVVLNAISTKKGFYQVANCKNVTRGFFKNNFSFMEVILILIIVAPFFVCIAACIGSGIWWFMFDTFPFKITFLIFYALLFLKIGFNSINDFKESRAVKNYPIENLEDN